MASSILLLSGPVGAGKTTVGRELVKLWPAPLAYIEGDTFWWFFAKDNARGPTYEKFKTVMSSMIAAAIPFAASGSRVIVDFSIPPWFLDDARTIAKQTTLDYVVLRPSEAVCATRAAARPSGTIADYTPYRDLYRDFDARPSHIICDDHASAVDMAARIKRGCEDRVFRLS